jgi:uncharacterized protein (TIGR03067 family)
MRTISLFLITAILLAGDATAGDSSAKDLKQLEGTWEVVSTVLSGKEVTEAIASFVIKGEKVTHLPLKGKKDEPREGDTFKIDSSKMPKQIDWTVNQKGVEKKVLQGIFEIKGDDLTICFDTQGKGRPTTFTSKEGSGYRLVKSKRIKR